MERISIFNYEAFYLDFLEGNLSEEDTVLLFEFLDKHPELKLEDEGLVTLTDDVPALDDQFKMGLKQLEFNETAITPNNAEQFMIAETEGLLNADKLNELDKFVGTDSERIKLRKTFAATRLKPDVRVVFVDKDSLKRTRRIALWPIISLAAACAVALFLLWDPADSAITNQVNQTFAQKDPKTPQQNSSQTKDGDNTSAEPSTTPVQVAVVNTVVNEENQVLPAKVKAADPVKPDLLKIKRAKMLPDEVQEPEIVHSTWSKPQQVQVNEPKNDYTAVGFDDMNNPIKPITNRLSDVVKQEVDFRTAKPTEKTSGGFYVKIGKFELSHRKHK